MPTSPSSQDFTKGVDFTGLPSATGSDHNNLVDLAVPHDDTAAGFICGMGLTMITYDQPSNTPVVPDPTASPVYTKWKRYLWIRIIDTVAQICYVWNDNGVNDATYKKWKQFSPSAADVTNLQTQITALQTRATADEVLITTAQARADAAYTAATQLKDNYAIISGVEAAGVGASPASYFRLFDTVESNTGNLITLGGSPSAVITFNKAGAYLIECDACINIPGPAANTVLFYNAFTINGVEDPHIGTEVNITTVANFITSVYSKICAIRTVAVSDILKIVSHITYSSNQPQAGTGGAATSRLKILKIG